MLSTHSRYSAENSTCLIRCDLQPLRCLFSPRQTNYGFKQTMLLLSNLFTIFFDVWTIKAVQKILPFLDSNEALIPFLQQRPTNIRLHERFRMNRKFFQNNFTLPSVHQSSHEFFHRLQFPDRSRHRSILSVLFSPNLNLWASINYFTCGLIPLIQQTTCSCMVRLFSKYLRKTWSATC